MEYLCQPRNLLDAVEAEIRRATRDEDFERLVRLEEEARRVEADLIAWEIDLAGQ
jgi:hypothetical protein